MFRRLPLSLRFTLATFVLGLQPAQAIAQNAVRVVPAEIDLGERVVASQVPSSTWLINTTDETVKVVSAKGGCGCITLDAFEASEIGPRRALRVPFTIGAPKEVGKHKDTHLNFKLEDGSVVQLGLKLKGVASVAPTARVEPVDDVALEAAPAQLAFTNMTPEETRTASIFWINTSDDFVETKSIKAGCGCTTIAGFEPGPLAPGEALKIDLTVKAPKKHGKQTKWVYLALADGQVAKAALELESVEKVAARR